MEKFNLGNKISNLLFYITCDNPISKKYRLNKLDSYLKPIDFEIIKLLVNSQHIDCTRMLTNTKDTVISDEIDKFLTVLKNNFKEEDLHNFYYNTEWLKVSKKKFCLSDILKNRTTYGQYDIKTNELLFYKIKKDVYTYHELFHLSSRDTTRTDYSTGFSLDISSGVIGFALNEGYTQLLALRYLEESIEDNDCYYLETKIANDLEMLVGKDKMQSLYLNAALFGLFNELEKYYTSEEIIEFIIKFDLIGTYIYKKFISDEEIDRISLLMEDVLCFLIKGFSKYLLSQNNDIETNKELLISYLQDRTISYGEYMDYEFDINRINKVIMELLGFETKLDEYILKKEKSCYNKYEEVVL